MMRFQLETIIFERYILTEEFIRAQGCFNCFKRAHNRLFYKESKNYFLPRTLGRKTPVIWTTK